MEFTNHILLASISTISEVVIIGIRFYCDLNKDIYFFPHKQIQRINIRKAQDKYLAPSLISDQKYITLPPKSHLSSKGRVIYV